MSLVVIYLTDKSSPNASQDSCKRNVADNRTHSGPSSPPREIAEPEFTHHLIEVNAEEESFPGLLNGPIERQRPISQRQNEGVNSLR